MSEEAVLVDWHKLFPGLPIDSFVWKGLSYLSAFKLRGCQSASEARSWGGHRWLGVARRARASCSPLPEGRRGRGTGRNAMGRGCYDPGRPLRCLAGGWGGRSWLVVATRAVRSQARSQLGTC